MAFCLCFGRKPKAARDRGSDDSATSRGASMVEAQGGALQPRTNTSRAQRRGSPPRAAAAAAAGQLQQHKLGKPSGGVITLSAAHLGSQTASHASSSTAARADSGATPGGGPSTSSGRPQPASITLPSPHAGGHASHIPHHLLTDPFRHSSRSLQGPGSGVPTPGSGSSLNLQRANMPVSPGAGPPHRLSSAGLPMQLADSRASSLANAAAAAAAAVAGIDPLMPPAPTPPPALRMPSPRFPSSQVSPVNVNAAAAAAAATAAGTANSTGLPPLTHQMLLSSSSTVTISEADSDEDDLPSPGAPIDGLHPSGRGPAGGMVTSHSSHHSLFDGSRASAQRMSDVAYIRQSLAALRQATLAGLEEEDTEQIPEPLPGLPRMQRITASGLPLGSGAGAGTSLAAGASGPYGTPPGSYGSGGDASGGLAAAPPPAAATAALHESAVVALFGGGGSSVTAPAAATAAASYSSTDTGRMTATTADTSVTNAMLALMAGSSVHAADVAMATDRAAEVLMDIFRNHPIVASSAAPAPASLPPAKESLDPGEAPTSSSTPVPTAKAHAAASTSAAAAAASLPASALPRLPDPIVGASQPDPSPPPLPPAPGQPQGQAHLPPHLQIQLDPDQHRFIQRLVLQKWSPFGVPPGLALHVGSFSRDPSIASTSGQVPSVVGSFRSSASNFTGSALGMAALGVSGLGAHGGGVPGTAGNSMTWTSFSGSVTAARRPLVVGEGTASSFTGAGPQEGVAALQGQGIGRSLLGSAPSGLSRGHSMTSTSATSGHAWGGPAPSPPSITTPGGPAASRGPSAGQTEPYLETRSGTLTGSDLALGGAPVPRDAPPAAMESGGSARSSPRVQADAAAGAGFPAPTAGDRLSPSRTLLGGGSATPLEPLPMVPELHTSSASASASNASQSSEEGLGAAAAVSAASGGAGASEAPVAGTGSGGSTPPMPLRMRHPAHLSAVLAATGSSGSKASGDGSGGGSGASGSTDHQGGARGGHGSRRASSLLATAHGGTESESHASSISFADQAREPSRV